MIHLKFPRAEMGNDSDIKIAISLLFTFANRHLRSIAGKSAHLYPTPTVIHTRLPEYRQTQS